MKIPRLGLILWLACLGYGDRLTALVEGAARPSSAPVSGKPLLRWTWDGREGGLWKTETVESLRRRETRWRDWAAKHRMTVKELGDLPPESLCLLSRLPRDAADLKPLVLRGRGQEWTLYLYRRKSGGSGVLAALREPARGAGNSGGDPEDFPLPPGRTRKTSLLMRQGPASPGFYCYGLKWSPAFAGQWYLAQLSGRGFEVLRSETGRDGAWNWQIRRRQKTMLMRLEKSKEKTGTLMTLFQE
jgi:hypothetical protein